jgi:predicted nucleic acid-binding protein
MVVGIVDSTVVIHYFRKTPGAREWIDSRSDQLSVTPITWLEVMHGAPGKAGQVTSKAILGRFEMEYLTRSDLDWAMAQMERLRLSHGVGINDCLIASVCFRLQVPLYTHNVKHMRVFLPEAQVIQPY